jgi:ribosomal protein L16 Arg81 hydroxylase|tara:strand:- start:263 stop:961 length:699 start_codon:yes stop_codon:yes gene_type:complete
LPIPFDNLINPITRERFFDEFKGKKHFVIKSKTNIFKHHFSWHEFDNYLNQIKVGQWDRTPQLQVVLPNGNKWCKKKHKEQYSREQILDFWNQGSSFILTLSEFLNGNMWKQCQEFEKVYGIGQANIYCSKRKDAHCFPIHADSTDNFLFHVSGKIRWYIYKEFSKDLGHQRLGDATLEEVVELDDGDLLYIPKGKFHRVDTLSPRISISFHFQEATPGKPYRRREWYDWKP